MNCLMPVPRWLLEAQLEHQSFPTCAPGRVHRFAAQTWKPITGTKPAPPWRMVWPMPSRTANGDITWSPDASCRGRIRTIPPKKDEKGQGTMGKFHRRIIERV